MEDCRIIDLFFQRSEEAIRETDAKYGSYCFSIAHSILADSEDARETVNDTYMACWNAIPPHRPNSFSAFLGKITRRISINRYHASHAAKRGGGQMPLALEELSECIPAQQEVEGAMEEKALIRLLNAFVRKLPEAERKVFLCRYWYLEPVSIIAKRFDFSESKVKSMLFRIRNKLRKQLEQEGITV